MEISEIKTKLITAGVKNLHEFGYPNCNEENILTDEVYSEFFKSMLVDNKGNGAAIDKAINEIISQLPNL